MSIADLKQPAGMPRAMLSQEEIILLGGWGGAGPLLEQHLPIAASVQVEYTISLLGGRPLQE